MIRVWTDCPQRDSDALVEPVIVGCDGTTIVTLSSACPPVPENDPIGTSWLYPRKVPPKSPSTYSAVPGPDSSHASVARNTVAPCVCDIMWSPVNAMRPVTCGAHVARVSTVVW